MSSKLSLEKRVLPHLSPEQQEYIASHPPLYDMILEMIDSIQKTDKKPLLPKTNTFVSHVLFLHQSMFSGQGEIDLLPQMFHLLTPERKKQMVWSILDSSRVLADPEKGAKEKRERFFQALHERHLILPIYESVLNDAIAKKETQDGITMPQAMPQAKQLIERGLVHFFVDRENPKKVSKLGGLRQLFTMGVVEPSIIVRSTKAFFAKVAAEWVNAAPEGPIASKLAPLVQSTALANDIIDEFYTHFAAAVNGDERARYFGLYKISRVNPGLARELLNYSAITYPDLFAPIAKEIALGDKHKYRTWFIGNLDERARSLCVRDLILKNKQEIEDIAVSYQDDDTLSVIEQRKNDLLTQLETIRNRSEYQVIQEISSDQSLLAAYNSKHEAIIREAELQQQKLPALAEIAVFVEQLKGFVVSFEECNNKLLIDNHKGELYAQLEDKCANITEPLRRALKMVGVERPADNPSIAAVLREKRDAIEEQARVRELQIVKVKETIKETISACMQEMKTIAESFDPKIENAFTNRGIDRYLEVFIGKLRAKMGSTDEAFTALGTDGDSLRVARDRVYEECVATMTTKAASSKKTIETNNRLATSLYNRYLDKPMQVLGEKIWSLKTLAEQEQRELQDQEEGVYGKVAKEANKMYAHLVILRRDFVTSGKPPNETLPDFKRNFTEEIEKVEGILGEHRGGAAKAFFLALADVVVAIGLLGIGNVIAKAVTGRWGIFSQPTDSSVKANAVKKALAEIPDDDSNNKDPGNNTPR